MVWMLTISNAAFAADDSDYDGVHNNLDQCPDTQSGTLVDSLGCPTLDSDHDGIADSADLCPDHNDNIDINDNNIPDGCDALVDSDADGISNRVDECPHTAINTSVDHNGCAADKLTDPLLTTNAPTGPSPCPDGQGRATGEKLSILGVCATPDDCMTCHKDAVRFPVLERSIGDRHHVTYDPATDSCFTCHNITNSGPITLDSCLSACHLNLTDLPTNPAGLPITVVGSPASGTNRHHYTDTFLNGSCHDCHVPPETQLTSSEICVGCHDGSVTQKNIVGSFDQLYSHPLDALGQSANGVQVSCLDCHNPKQVTSDNRLRGVVGVEPNFPGNFQEVNSFATVESVEKQYQLCFKCHSANQIGNKFGNNFATNPPKDSHHNPEFLYNSRNIEADDDGGRVTLSGWDGSLTDQAKEFNPNNNSYHPVVAPGKNDFKMGTRDYSSSLINGWTPDSVMNCDDCHRDSNNPEIDGPHGSGVWPIASAPFTGNTGLSNSSFLTDMCFKCHDRDVYGYGNDSSKDDHFRTGFSNGEDNLHYYHVEGKDAQCTTCHSAVPHGWKRKALLVWGAGQNPDPAPYNNHAKYSYDNDTYSYGINSATPIDSIQSGQWYKEVCHDAGGGTGTCK